MSVIALAKGESSVALWPADNNVVKQYASTALVIRGQGETQVTTCERVVLYVSDQLLVDREAQAIAFTGDRQVVRRFLAAVNGA